MVANSSPNSQTKHLVLEPTWIENQLLPKEINDDQKVKAATRAAFTFE